MIVIYCSYFTVDNHFDFYLKNSLCETLQKLYQTLKRVSIIRAGLSGKAKTSTEGVPHVRLQKERLPDFARSGECLLRPLNALPR